MYVKAGKDSKSSKGSKKLPGVSIGDHSVEGAGWKWSEGWNGLKVSQSTLDDAKSLLGPITGESELANGVTYDFLEGKIRITVLDGSNQIVKVWVDSQAPQPFSPPQNVDDAIRSFGKLVTTGVSRNEGVIFERPGMRICCNAMDETNTLRWLEVFKPFGD